MAELRAYTCDGGCGENVVLDKPHDSPTTVGWLVLFRPNGEKPRHTCSEDCMIRALSSDRALRP